MSNAMVNSIGSDTSILLTGLNANNQTTGASLSDTDFSTILGQTREKTLQTATTDTGNSTAKNPTREKQTDVSEKSTTVEAETAKKVTTQEEREVSEKTDTDVKQTVQEQSMAEETQPDEEELEAIAEAVNQIFLQAAQILEMSETELQSLLEELSLNPVELLNPETMVSLALAAGGEDSVIGIVMNEDIYNDLNDLLQMVNEELNALTEQTGMTEEELAGILEQVKNMVMEDGAEEVLLKEPQMTQIGETQSGDLMEENRNTVAEGQNKTEASQMSEEMTGEPETHMSAVSEKDTESRQAYSSQQEMSQNQEMTPFQQDMQTIQQNAGAAEGVPDMTTDYAPTPENILKQLADYVKVHAGKELTEMEIQLHPASLGNVHISIANRGGTISAQITTQNEAVKEVIEAQIVNLKSSLEEQGIKVEAVEVSVASHQMEKNLEQGGKDRRNQEDNSDKTDGIRKIRRTSINLNAWQDEEMEEMDEEEADAVNLTKEMMQLYGNSMDLLA